MSEVVSFVTQQSETHILFSKMTETENPYDAGRKK